MIRTYDDLVAVYEAELAEKDGLKAHEEIIHLLAQPGWRRFQDWLSSRRDNVFSQLRHIQGPATIIAESFLKWQTVDALFEDIQDYIKHTVEHGEDILRRQQSALTEQFERGEISYGGPNGNPGASNSGTPTGYTDPIGGTTDSYRDPDGSGF